MSGEGERRLVMSHHPTTPCAAVRRMQVSVVAGSDGTLTLAYELDADMSRLSLASPGSGRRADELWRHTCFEAFLTGEAGAYREFNFAPSGDWAAYEFKAYRAGRWSPPLATAPSIESARTAHDFTLTATFTPDARAERARLGLAAVIEDVDGSLSYWALRHPRSSPDFHHADGFVLEI
jgi:hypothetical protein